jgi:lauroyl/myristoyl acyltransferase
VPGAPSRAFLAYRAGAEVARALPPALGLALARGTSRGMVAVWTSRRRQVERNLVRASRGTLRGRALRDATSRMFGYYARYWYEMFRLRESIDSLEDIVESVGYERITDAERAGTGVILALPHLGNWDVAGAWLAHRGHKLTVVAETAEPPELFEWFVEERRALGMEVIALGPNALVEVLGALKAGRVVCLLCDRDISGDGSPVEFFGEPTTMPGGPALAALRTGVPLIPVGVYFREGGRHLVRFLPPIPAQREGSLREDVNRVTGELAAQFEALISEAPEQWLVMQPVWPADAEAGHNSPRSAA